MSATSLARRSPCLMLRDDDPGEAFNVGSADQNYLIRDPAEVVRK